MNKRNLFNITIIITMLAFTVIFAQRYHIYPSFAQIEADDEHVIYEELRALAEALQRVRSDYVEQPDDKKLIDAAISGMLRSLDPHSSYLNEQSYRDIKISTSGEFGGIGIEITTQDDYIVVVTPIEDTPGYRAGIMSGDLITKIDGDSIFKLPIAKVVEKMRGEIGTKVVLSVLRKIKGQDEKQEISILIIRDIIKIKSVKYHINNNVGYIRITQFSEQTSTGLEKAVKNIKSKIVGDKIKGYIIDLRNNPGGLLDQAIKVTDMFLERGEIVSTQARNPQDIERFHASKGDVTEGKDIVVLINGGSASASEIVAGALLDHKRAYIVGTRTFGKGSVQTVFSVGQNRAIRLTTSRYFTPSGRSIQAKGIEAQFVVEQNYNEITNRTQRGESMLQGHLKALDGDKNQQSGSSDYVPLERENDVQYQFAIKILTEGIEAAKKIVQNQKTRKNTLTVDLHANGISQ